MTKTRKSGRRNLAKKVETHVSVRVNVTMIDRGFELDLERNVRNQVLLHIHRNPEKCLRKIYIIRILAAEHLGNLWGKSRSAKIRLQSTESSRDPSVARPIGR